MKFKIGYGKNPEYITIKEENIIDVLEHNEIQTEKRGRDAVRKSLDNPIGTKKLNEIVEKGQKIVIITSDVTRPCPSYEIIPELLDDLFEAGIKNEDITIVFALGSHRKHTEKEKISLVGKEIYEKIECIDSDINDCVHLGLTSSGTPVDIFSKVVEADFRIGIGNIEFHYFAGYSGGAKAIMPGVSTPEAIQANHAKMTLPESVAGNIYNNPVRQDLEEAMEYISLDFIVNVILDENKEIIHSVAGDFIKAHRKGCELLDEIYKIDVDEYADIVLVSQGGYPKDLNLYQTQKALDNAKHIIKDDGIIILVGECQEGFGNSVFEEYMLKKDTPEEIINSIENKFVLGGHKAAAIALIAEKASIYLVSEFDSEIVESIFMKPFKTVQDALDSALEIKGENARVLLMPNGGTTLPNKV